MSRALDHKPYAPTIVILAVTLLLGACGSQQAVKPVERAVDWQAEAERYLRRGEYQAAAGAFERLAAASGEPGATRYRLIAALALEDGGDFARAQEILALPVPDDDIAKRTFMLIDAVQKLQQQAYPQSITALESIDVRNLTPYQRGVYYRTAGKARFHAADYQAALQAFAAADRFPLSDADRRRLHNAIWQTLVRLDSASLARLEPDADANLKGWLELARLVKPTLHNQAELQIVVAQWQQRHASHPATLALIETLLEYSENLSVTFRHIALLLPFNGRFADVARTIRDGFVTAWYADPRVEMRPIVSIYSAGPENVNAVYDRAVAAGADLVVGPLQKSALEVLLGREELPVTTLALNSLDKPVPSEWTEAETVGQLRLFQYGLLPEEEAAQAAERAYADGFSRAVVLGPETEWGERLLSAFGVRWDELGGELLTRANYGAGNESYAAAVKQALNVDLSEARAAQLRTVLRRSIQFEPRRRTDVDVIFLAGFPVNARQLMPQLRYFRAENIQVFSTSAAFSGRTDAAADQDLDGLEFGDMPWIFGHADQRSQAVFARHWRAESLSPRLFAFGIDAYRLIPYLSQLQHQPGLRIPGVTGALQMDAAGRIHRRVSWARFDHGIPTAID